MYRFGTQSKSNLETCHPKILAICYTAILEIDFKVICGWRNKEQQDYAYARAYSKVKWPNSQHNCYKLGEGGLIIPESRAFDFVPWDASKRPQFDWNDLESFKKVARVISESAYDLGIGVELGAINWGWDHGHVELWREEQ